MTEHVSVETARKMAAAGWQWDPHLGDRFESTIKHNGEVGIYLVVWVAPNGLYPVRGLGIDNRKTYDFEVAECLHLPTIGQILEALVNMGAANTGAWPDLWYTPLSRQWHCQTTHAHEKQAEIAEAAAACWLAAKDGRAWRLDSTRNSTIPTGWSERHSVTVTSRWRR